MTSRIDWLKAFVWLILLVMIPTFWVGLVLALL